jgi:hypothetical protein
MKGSEGRESKGKDADVGIKEAGKTGFNSVEGGI